MAGADQARALQQLAYLVATVAQREAVPPGAALPYRAHRAFGYIEALTDVGVLQQAEASEWTRRIMDALHNLDPQRHPGAWERRTDTDQLPISATEQSKTWTFVDAKLVSHIPLLRGDMDGIHELISLEIWTLGVTVRWVTRLSGAQVGRGLEEGLPDLALEDDVGTSYEILRRNRVALWRECLRLESDFVPAPPSQAQRLRLIFGDEVLSFGVHGQETS